MVASASVVGSLFCDPRNSRLLSRLRRPLGPVLSQYELVVAESPGRSSRYALEHIFGWFDVLHSEINFRLSPVVRGIREGPREHFDPRGLPSFPNIKHFVELRGSHGAKVFGAPVEGIGKKLDSRLFVGAGGLSQRVGSRNVREGLRVGFCDVDHELAEAHLFWIRFEIV